MTETCLSLMEGKLLPSLYNFKKIFAYLSCVSSHSDLLQLDFRKYSLQKEILALASATGNYRSIIYHTHQYNITLTDTHFDYSEHCSKSLGAQDVFLQMARTSKFRLNQGVIIHCLCQLH